MSLVDEYETMDNGNNRMKNVMIQGCLIPIPLTYSVLFYHKSTHSCKQWDNQRKERNMTKVTNPQWHQCASHCCCAKRSLTARRGLDHIRFSLHSLLYHTPAEPQTVNSNATLHTSTYTTGHTQQSVPWYKLVLAVLIYSVPCYNIYCPALWIGGHSSWLLTMRSQVRFPTLPCAFFLERGRRPWWPRSG